jgi:hypothetical protein
MTALGSKLDTPDLARLYEEASSDRQFEAGSCR